MQSHRYRLHDTTGDDVGVLEHPAPNVEPGDVVILPDGREAIVTSRVETQRGPLAALLQVAVAPTPLESDDGVAQIGRAPVVAHDKHAQETFDVDDYSVESLRSVGEFIGSQQ
jgi:hypothetical protein